MAAKRYKNASKFFQTLGARIKALRTERGLTQEDMMELGFSVRFYQRIEAGKPIHLKTILKVADAFNLKVSELFEGM